MKTTFRTKTFEINFKLICTTQRKQKKETIGLIIKKSCKLDKKGNQSWIENLNWLRQ